MLRKLYIENIAVIEKAEIDFEPGLNVLTGETGTGKSIIIDSIEAVIGSRASKDLIRTGAPFASVTAEFDRDEAWLEENEIDSDDDTMLIQRRISADGKNSCRVCGVPVSISQLKSLGVRTLEVHGQNDGLKLLDEKVHLASLDRFGSLDLTGYRDAFSRLCLLREEYARLKASEEDNLSLREKLQDSIAELSEQSVRSGERDELIARRDLLRNSEKLTESLQLIQAALDGEEGALARVQEAEWHCRRASSISPELKEAEEQLKQGYYLISDAEERILDYQSALNFEPEEYDRLEQRLRDISRLERKYHCEADELPQLLEQSIQRLDDISFAGERLTKLDAEIQKQLSVCDHLAEELHRNRAEAAGKLSKVIESELKDLNMPGAKFLTELTRPETLNRNGRDSARFLLAANRGEEPGRISKIASGGELSRIMLAMKNALSVGDPVPTMIFDEIDTGVSGIAAQRVGEKLADLSRRKQVLCVTHLPQIAAMADSHFCISKSERNARTVTEVVKLNRTGRQQELARLHGGDHITATTLLSAEEQLKYAESYKKQSE